LAVLAELRLYAPFGVLVPKLQAQRLVHPASLLHTGLPGAAAYAHGGSHCARFDIVARTNCASWLTLAICLIRRSTAVWSVRRDL
jgi:hypothetical protein